MQQNSDLIGIQIIQVSMPRFTYAFLMNKIRYRWYYRLATCHWAEWFGIDIVTEHFKARKILLCFGIDPHRYLYYLECKEGRDPHVVDLLKTLYNLKDLICLDLTAFARNRSD